MTTVTINYVKAKLSCNHTQDVPAGQPVGATVECDKCPALKSGDQPTRRIKRIVGEAATQPVPTPANEVDAAEARIAELAEQAKQGPSDEDVQDALSRLKAELESPEAQAADTAATAIAEAAAERARDAREDSQAEALKTARQKAEEATPPVEPPAELPEADVMKARDEWRALKDWKSGGEKGDRPETPNLDALNADNAAGKPRTKKARKASRPKSELAAAVKKARESGKRGKGTPRTDEELVAYVVDQRKAHPGESSYNLKEYSWWVEGNAHGLKRWNDAWDAATAVMEAAEKS